MPIQQITTGIIANGAITAADLDANLTPQYVDTQSVHVMFYNAQNVTSNITVSANQNAFTAGPLTINAPYQVTLNAGSTWVIL
jgi:hypothetical protein